MAFDKDEVLKALDKIDVSSLNYTQWIEVGMALKEAGFSPSIWDNWSRNDKRYKEGECERKWVSFKGDSNPVTCASIFKMAGHTPNNNSALDWDSIIISDDKFEEPQKPLKPTEQLILYLSTLFKETDFVGYATNDSFLDKADNKWKPLAGVYSRTAGELIESLKKYPVDLGATVGDWHKEAGAWIRFNPLNGKGCGDKYVTRYDYCLVESDKVSLEVQENMYRKLNLPIAAMVKSGNKSIHAIIRIDAKDEKEYRERVAFCYEFLEKNGLPVDDQNSNPSRFSRMPGATRNGNEQTLIATNIGYSSYDEWITSLEKKDRFILDDISELVKNPPDLAPAIIDGLLRKGHKGLLSGPSKSGKSFMLIQLAISLAEGLDWIGFKCHKSKVCYINFEIDRASAINRFKDMYAYMGIKEPNSNVLALNLRGKAEPLDKLVAKMVDEFEGRGIDVFIIDPIYKVITGDENNASEMAHFCNQFDLICDKLHATVIYAHHHSKGIQGAKSAQDRSSGSGVFSRDPDAIIDMTELDLGDNFNMDVDSSTDSAFQVEFVTREFKRPKSRKIWFKYPLHIVDDKGELNDYYPRGAGPRNKPQSQKYEGDDEISEVLQMLDEGEGVTENDLAEYFEVTPRCIRNWVKKSNGRFILKNKKVTENPDFKDSKNSSEN